jgi:uncharacterized membrane protein affecting hemolysin expression
VGNAKKRNRVLYAPVYNKEASLVTSGSEELRKRKKKARNSSNSRKTKMRGAKEYARASITNSPMSNKIIAE